MPVRFQRLDNFILYIFNGRDFIINENLPPGDPGKIPNGCGEEDSKSIDIEKHSLKHFDKYIQIEGKSKGTVEKK